MGEAALGELGEDTGNGMNKLRRKRGWERRVWGEEGLASLREEQGKGCSLQVRHLSSGGYISNESSPQQFSSYPGRGHEDMFSIQKRRLLHRNRAK